MLPPGPCLPPEYPDPAVQVHAGDLVKLTPMVQMTKVSRFPSGEVEEYLPEVHLWSQLGYLVCPNILE